MQSKCHNKSVAFFSTLDDLSELTSSPASQLFDPDKEAVILNDLNRSCLPTADLRKTAG
jgi:hypothetical protein